MKSSRALLVAAVVLALCASAASAQSDAECQQGVQVARNSPAATAFKQCAAAGPKPGFKVECCQQLSPFVQYLGCLQKPEYQAQVNAFLAPATNLAEASQVCLSATGRRLRRHRTRMAAL